MAIGSVYRCLLEAAGASGVDTRRVLGELHLTEQSLVADARVSPEVGRQLVTRLVRYAEDPELGLKAAERIRLADLDLLGYVLWHSVDLCAFAENFARYSPLLGDTAAATCSRSRDRLSICLGRRGGRLFLPEGGDLIVGATARLMAEWSSGAASLREVHLVRSKPRDATRYERFFGAPIRFDADVGSLVYPNPSKPLVRADADPALGAILRRQADHVLASLRLDASLVDRTRAQLGHESDLGTSGVGRVAARLGLSERTLRRRLTEAGTSYRELVDDARRERALTLALEGVHSVTAMAMRSGFTNVTAFTRAFRRWTGKLPSEYLGEVRIRTK